MMDIVASNPFRIIGVFANEPVRVRTANIGRIRAFAKVNKPINFNVDMQGLLGDFNRTLENADSANLLLADQTKEAIYSLFWFHKNSSFNDSTILEVCEGNYLRLIKLHGEVGDYSGLINAAVLALIMEDYSSAVSYYTSFIESGSLISDFREAMNYPKSILSNKEFIQRFIQCLVEEYPGVEWWSLFLEKSHKRPVLNYIKTVFEKIAIRDIRVQIDDALNKKDVEPRNYLSIARTLKKNTINCVKVLEPLEGADRKADSQLALDKLGEEILRECKVFYGISKFENEQSVLPTLQLTNYALSLTCGSDIFDDGAKFKKELEKDADLLPPKEIFDEATFIKHEISSYCQKPDEIRWAMILVRNCAPKLLQIKMSIGKVAPYYVKISTKLADNALFNCDAEVEKAVKQLNTPELQSRLSDTLRNAWKLQLNLNQLDVDSLLRNGKLQENESTLKRYLKRFNVNADDVSADISMQTEEEVFNQCVDYASLSNFCRENPNSRYIKDAIKKIWEIEDDNYPVVISVKSLLNFKQAYPTSHHDLKILSQLDSMLLSNSNGTIYDYRQFLRLYPNHTSKLEILRRIDMLSFKQCKTVDDYKQYLSDFKSGAYRKQAESKIDDAIFLACKTISELNHYVVNNPNGNHSQEALDKIEELVYKSVCHTKRYNEYLERYPSGKYSNGIRNQLENELFGKCSSISDFKNYLKRYPTGQFAEIAKRAIQKKKAYPFKIAGGIAAIIFILAVIVNIAKSSNNNRHSTANSNVQTEQSRVVENSNDVTSNNAPVVSEVEEWGDNHLETGDKPYSEYFGRARSGENYLSFNTSGDCDYIIIVKRASDSRYINHVYINGGDNARLYLPNGHYNIYFYSGKGWNPNKVKGNMLGGFVLDESQQKDGPIKLFSAYGEYTLYPVANGNLQLSSVGEDEVFD